MEDHIGPESATSVSTLKVSIHDKVSKLQTYFIEGAQSGQLLYKNKMIGKNKLIGKDELEKSFAENGILDNTKFVLLQDGSKQNEILKWVRFTTFMINGESKINLSQQEWDAVCFVPKTRVNFYGFGVFANR